MSDLPNLDAARAALANAMRLSWQVWCECGAFRNVVYVEPTSTKAANPCRDCRGVTLEFVKQDGMSTVDAALLSDALAVVDGLTARLAEAEATLANERGEGEPPSEGWEWTGACWTRDLGNNEEARVSLDATGLDTEVPRWRCFLESADDWDGDFIVPSAPTARAAMRGADSALAAKVAP